MTLTLSRNIQRVSSVATVRGVLGFAPVFLAARKDLGTGCRKLGKMEKDEEEVVVVGHTVDRVFYKN